jgi:hypothetical protein
MCLKQREIRTLRNAIINHKLRSKKTVQLKIVDANIYTVWCEEMAKKLKKGANKKQTKKGNARQKKQQQSKKRDYRRERAYALLTNSRNNRELEESIDLFIGEEFDVTNEGGDNDNGVKK